MEFSIFSLALTFFLVTNPAGNSPAIVSLVKDFPLEKQKKILFREGIIALCMALFFQFFGEIFLSILQVKGYAVTLCGGIILFLTALEMIFGFSAKTAGEKAPAPVEPFIVPIATPLLSGPGLLTIIMLFSKKASSFFITCSILLSWIGVMMILWMAPYMQKVLGKRGLTALEQLMGMILGFIAIQMLLEGLKLFTQTLT